MQRAQARVGALARAPKRHRVARASILVRWRDLRGRFAQWREYAYRVRKNKIEEKENFKRAVALWSGKNLAGCFLRWKMTLERRRGRRRLLLLASKSRRARILRAWSVEATKSAALNAIGGDIQAQARHRLKVMFYVKWRAAFHERQRRRDIMSVVAGRMRQRALAGAFGGWRSKVEEVIDVREKLRGIAARFANQELNGAFNRVVGVRVQRG